MRTVVPVLLPWLLLLPLCWVSDDLNPLQCGTGVNPLSADIVNEIDPNKRCSAEWRAKTFTEMDGFIMRIIDKCYDNSGNDNWVTSEAAVDCILHTTFSQNCKKGEMKDSQGTQIEQEPLEYICNYYKYKVLEIAESVLDKSETDKFNQIRKQTDPVNCKEFSTECEEKFEQRSPTSSTLTTTKADLTTEPTTTIKVTSTEASTTSTASTSKITVSRTLQTRQLPRGMLRDYNDEDFKNDDYKPQDDYNGEDDDDDDETPKRASASILYRAIFTVVFFIL